MQIKEGNPFSLGATLTKDGVNFALYSKDATRVTLFLFDSPDSKLPSSSFDLNKDLNKTGDIWHIEICGIKEGSLYLYKMDGPYNPPKGLRFNYHKYLLDPYAKEFTKGSVFLSYNNLHKIGFSANEGGELFDLSNFPKCVVINDAFNWEGDRPLNYPLDKTIIYETHLKAFTANENSNIKEDERGTYKAFTKKIEYLKELGITSVELLPVFEFDENEIANSNPRTGQMLKNFWGYSTIGFFAPKTTYAFSTKPGNIVNEFKQMVKDLHKNGIEVILDVVFNHTAEGNEQGYTFSFRGLQNDVYYALPKEMQYYMNYSGCGNSLNCNHPIVVKFIIDCLRYWVLNMHVDGFRFDLASILTRDQNGIPTKFPVLTTAINDDPILSKTKIIAEPWDCAGLYQLGNFPGGNRWSEWNGRFRDDIRRFIRGDENTSTAAATRVSGSSDCYNHDGKSPFNSINFITCHDGFTLNDLVSYNYKHNDENGEKNRDGADENFSYNHGFEGECINPKIELVREKKIKNFFLYLFTSQGIPMMLYGDEVRRSQNGNNNVYCQDNILSWMDWSLVEKNKALFRYVKLLIELRKQNSCFTKNGFFNSNNDDNSALQIQWYDTNAKTPIWEQMNRFLAFKLSNKHENKDFYIATNTDIYDLTITLPSLTGNKKWYRIVDTSFESPNDILENQKEELLKEQKRYVLVSTSSIVLIGK